MRAIFINNNIDEKHFFLDKSAGSKNPERSCVACRKKSVKEVFFRFVYSPDSGVICDIRKKLQSRGVYICPKKECIKIAIKKKVFSRVFKRESIEPSFEELVDGIYKGLQYYLFDLMKLALKSGKLKRGSAAVFDAVEKGKVYLLMLSQDAGRSIRDKIEYLSKELSIELVYIPDKLFIAEQMDKSVTAVVAVTDNGFADSLKKGWGILSEVKTWYDGESKWQ